MIRQIATVSTGTLSSRLLGFIRDMLMATLLGTGIAADAFVFAFQLVNVSRRLLSEGAFNAALVPPYLRIRHERGEVAARAFAGRVLGTVSLAMIAATILLGLVMPLVVSALAPGFADGTHAFAVDTARLMLPYLAFVGPVAVLMALLNATGRVAWSAFSPLLFNLLLIAAMLLLIVHSGDPARAALALSLTVGLAGLLQGSALLVPGAPLAQPIRISVERDVAALLRRTFPATLAQSGPQLLVLAGAMAASLSPGSIAAIYFANRLIELPLGVVGVGAGAVFVTRMSDAHHQGGGASIAIQSRAIELGLGLALPAAIGLALLADPIVAALFQHGAFDADDTVRTAAALVLLAAALPAHALFKLLSPICFAREETRWPLLAVLAGVLIAVIAAFGAQPAYAEAGIAAAIALGAWSSAAIIGLHLATAGSLRLDEVARRRLPRILLASLVMALVLWASRTIIGGMAPGGIAQQIAALALLIVIGLASYVALLRLLGVATLAKVRAAFRQSH